MPKARVLVDFTARFKCCRQRIRTRCEGLVRIRTFGLIAIVVSVLIVGLLAYEFGPSLWRTEPLHSKELVVASAGDSTSLDTGLWTARSIDGAKILTMCEPLYDPVTLKPLLAESYEVSSDGLNWTFHLRHGVKFHDGTPFNATCVKFSYERQCALKDPYYGKSLRYRSNLEMVANFTVIDDYTIRLTTKYVFAGLLYRISHPSAAIISPTAVATWKEAYGEHPVGTGPYNFSEWVTGERLVMEKNDEYWGEPKPYWDRIIWKTIEDDNARLMAFEKGEVQIIDRPIISEFQRLNSTPGLAVITSPSSRATFFGFNNAKAPFTDQRVRWAINYAVDREAILEKILSGFGTLTDSMCTPATPGYKSIMTYEYNVSKAKQLLAEAGYPNGTGMRTLRLYLPVGRFYKDLEIAEAFQGYMKAVGINLEIVIVDWAIFTDYMTKPVEKREDDLFALALGVSSVDINYAVGRFFSPAQIGKDNYFVYNNTEFMALNDESIEEVNVTRQYELWAEMQRIFMEDCPTLFLHSENLAMAIRTNIKGAQQLFVDQIVVKYSWYEA